MNRILLIILTVGLFACGSEPSVEVNACNCFEAMEHGNEAFSSILEPCREKMADETFVKEYNKCKIADMRGIDPSEVKIPDVSETEKPLLELPMAGTYSVDTGSSNMTWSAAKLTGDRHTGTVKFKSGNLVVGDGTLESGSFILDMTTLANLDVQEEEQRTKLEGHLKSADFFDVDQHAEATFTFDTPATLNEFRAEVSGSMTIRGVSQDITMPVTVVKTSTGGLVLSGAKNIDRTPFGITFGSSALADQFIEDEFSVNFSVHGSPQ